VLKLARVSDEDSGAVHISASAEDQVAFQPRLGSCRPSPLGAAFTKKESVTVAWRTAASGCHVASAPQLSLRVAVMRPAAVLSSVELAADSVQPLIVESACTATAKLAAGAAPSAATVPPSSASPPVAASTQPYSDESPTGEAPLGHVGRGASASGGVSSSSNSCQCGSSDGAIVDHAVSRSRGRARAAQRGQPFHYRSLYTMYIITTIQFAPRDRRAGQTRRPPARP